MTHLRLLLADPGLTRVDGEHGTWFLSALRDDRLRDVVVDAPTIDAVRDELTATAEDAVVLHVSRTRNGGTVEAYRSVTSSRSLYYLTGSDGAVVVADHYRNALAQLSPADRTLSRRAVADHLLFRSPVAPATYVEEVAQLGRGDYLRWDGDRDGWRRDRIDRLSVEDDATPAEARRRIDEALVDLVGAGVDRATSTMFSGGVDSTLLHSYRDDAAPTMHVSVDAPEFEHESAAVERAADLLDVTPTEVAVQERDFLDHLERTVDALGLPPRYNQTVVTDAAFRAADAGRYLNGHGADALFGVQGLKAARIADWLGPTLPVVDPLAGRAPGGVGDALSALQQRREQLSVPPSTPRSLAQDLASDIDPDAVGQIFGEELVSERVNRRTEYAHRRAALTADSTFAQQVESGHLVDFLADDGVSQWRQLGHVHGKTIAAPFRTRRLARCALSVPPDRRYVRGLDGLPDLQPKHLLKSVLEDRVPDYPTSRQKGDGSLPIRRYFERGPLSAVFERYHPPEFLPPAAHVRHVDSFGPLTWQLLTFAVWRDRVLREPALEPVPGTEDSYVRLPRDPPSPMSTGP